MGSRKRGTDTGEGKRSAKSWAGSRVRWWWEARVFLCETVSFNRLGARFIEDNYNVHVHVVA